MSRPTESHLARGAHGTVLKANFSTEKSARTRAMQAEYSPPELLAPRRWTPPSESTSS